MMTGVLVIAFPVSVFSDLWSRELKRSGAIDALDADDEDDDNDNDANVEKEIENGNLAAAARKLVAELENPATPVKTGTNIVIPTVDDVTASVASLPGELPSMKRRQSSSSLKPNQVAIDRDDLFNLLSHVQIMQESQREIKSILRKYKFQLQQISSNQD